MLLHHAFYRGVSVFQIVVTRNLNRGSCIDIVLEYLAFGLSFQAVAGTRIEQLIHIRRKTDVPVVISPVVFCNFDFVRNNPIDGVEIDPEIIRVGREYFDMTEPNLNAVIADGRAFLAHIDRRYDVIGVDAYRLPYIPWHLSTV